MAEHEEGPPEGPKSGLLVHESCSLKQCIHFRILNTRVQQNVRERLKHVPATAHRFPPLSAEHRLLGFLEVSHGLDQEWRTLNVGNRHLEQDHPAILHLLQHPHPRPLLDPMFMSIGDQSRLALNLNPPTEIHYQGKIASHPEPLHGFYLSGVKRDANRNLMTRRVWRRSQGYGRIGRLKSIQEPRSSGTAHRD